MAQATATISADTPFSQSTVNNSTTMNAAPSDVPSATQADGIHALLPTSIEDEQAIMGMIAELRDSIVAKREEEEAEPQKKNNQKLVWKNRHAEAERKLKKKNEESKKLQREVEQLRETLEKADQEKVRKAKYFCNSLEKLKSRNFDLLSKAIRCDELEEEKKFLERSIRLSDVNIGLLRDLYIHETYKTENLKQEKHEMREELRNLKSEDEGKEVRESCLKNRIQLKNEKIEDLEKRLAETQIEISNLRQDVEDRDQQYYSPQNSMGVECYKQRVNDLQRQLEECQAQRDHFQQEARRVNDENADLYDQREEEASKTDIKDDQLDGLVTTTELLKQELTDSEARRNQLESQVTSTRSMLDSKQKEIEELKKVIEKGDEKLEKDSLSKNASAACTVQ